MRLSGLLILGFLNKTKAAIGDGRLLARIVESYEVCDAKLGSLELGKLPIGGIGLSVSIFRVF